jgi:translation initiation factor IF-3
LAGFGFKGNAGFRPRRPRVYIPLNEDIRAKRLRVINEDGENLGELSKDEALYLARSAGLDLFVVSEKADVPIAKILDYGKYKFEQSKKEKQQKKKQGGSDYKEIKMRYNIDIGDYKTRLAQAKKFIEKGLKVKLNITLRGREIQHSHLAKELAEKFLLDLMNVGHAETNPDKVSGRSIITFILPGPDKARIKKQDEASKLIQGSEENA